MSITGLAVFALLAGAGPKVELVPLKKTTPLLLGRCEVNVTFRLEVDDGGTEDYYCPRIEWQWEDESIAVEESDCPPFVEAAADDHRRAWVQRRSFQKSGRYLVRARLLKADRVIRTVETIAVVAGWSGYPDERRQQFGCSPARPRSQPPPDPFPQPLPAFPSRPSPPPPNWGTLSE